MNSRKILGLLGLVCLAFALGVVSASFGQDHRRRSQLIFPGIPLMNMALSTSLAKQFQLSVPPARQLFVRMGFR